MTPVQRVLAWVSTAAIVATGAAYAWLAYALEPADAFDVVNHPWQPTMLHLHVLAAPLWLFVLGVLWQSHVAPKLRSRSRARRKSGLAVLCGSLPMAASGYLLQTSVQDAWRTTWLVVHLTSSALWIVVFAVHVTARVRARVAVLTTRRLSESLRRSQR